MGIFGGEGRLVGGRYRLDIRLGRGGMGTVWRATDELLSRQVAVKELHLDEATSESEARVQRERAMREARTVAQVKHPNVIVVHDVVEQDGRPWIVMELVDGPSLADRLYSGGPLAPLEAARIGLALLGALQAAHARGVLHRDIKPANVLMESGTNRIVLTDFGIAQVPGATTLTETGGFVGSPEYTAPERMAGRGTGPEADLWSLGVLLCAALSGESPFRRDSIGGILHAVVYDEIEIPEAARPLLAVVEGLLERDPGRRLDVAETERLLEGYLRTGRAPERGSGGHWGSGRSAAAGFAEAAAAGAPAGPRSAAPAARDPFDDGHSDDLPGAGLPGDGVPKGGLPGGGAPGGPPSPGAPADAARPSSGSTPVAPTGYNDRRAPAEPASGRPGRARTLLLAALAVVVLGGGGAGITALVMNQNGDRTDQGRAGAPGGSQPPSHARPHPESAAGSQSGGSASGTPGPGASVTKPKGVNAPKAPAGYHLVRDPVGFALAVPDGFTRSYEDPRVYFYSQGKRFRIGVQLQQPKPEGPIGAMRKADAKPDYAGYRQGKVTETTHKGYRAGLWEFVWNGSKTDGGSRYTYDLSWDQDGKMIDVWVSAPVASQAEAKRYFDTAVNSFRLIGV